MKHWIICFFSENFCGTVWPSLFNWHMGKTSRSDLLIWSNHLTCCSYRGSTVWTGSLVRNTTESTLPPAPSLEDAGITLWENKCTNVQTEMNSVREVRERWETALAELRCLTFKVRHSWMVKHLWEFWAHSLSSIVLSLRWARRIIANSCYWRWWYCIPVKWIHSV